MTYPERTPIAKMTIEQQLNYWRHHARKHEERHRGGLAEIKSLRAEADRLRAELAARRSTPGRTPHPGVEPPPPPADALSTPTSDLEGRTK